MTNPAITNATVAQAYARDPSSELAADQQQRGLGQSGSGAATATPATSPATSVAGAPTAAPAKATSTTAAYNLETLAAAVGLEPDQLLDQVKSGEGLSDLLGKTAQTGYGSTVGESVRGGIMLDFYA